MSSQASLSAPWHRYRRRWPSAAGYYAPVARSNSWSMSGAAAGGVGLRLPAGRASLGNARHADDPRGEGDPPREGVALSAGLPLGLLAVNAAALGVGYCLLWPVLVGRGAREWLSYAGIALLLGVGLTALGVFVVVTLGARANTVLATAVAIVLAGAGVACRFTLPQRVLDAIERIVNAEAAASGAPSKPEITALDHYSLVTNDPEATKRVSNAFRLHSSSDRVQETKPTTASEDFGSFGAEWGVPSVFWFVGGIDSDMYDKAKKDGRIAEIPTNHNPRFAPVIHPTL